MANNGFVSSDIGSEFRVRVLHHWATDATFWMQTGLESTCGANLVKQESDCVLLRSRSVVPCGTGCEFGSCALD